MEAPILNELQYEDALAKAFEMMQLGMADDSPELATLEQLTIRISEYEDIYYPIPPPSFPLRGLPHTYIDPFEPAVDPDDWEVLGDISP